MSAPEGRPTRGTTNPNRLRRVDRYLAGPLAHVLRSAADPVVVDLGYGARAWTTVELHERLRAIRPDVRVVGVEIDPERVAAAQPWAAPDRAFLRGGFEVPVPAGWGRPVLVKACNVLRQYQEVDVGPAWQRMLSGLAPGGVLVEGTTDEIGRRASWVVLDAAGPQTLTVSLRLADVDRPGSVAERLPKALIHHNVAGEGVHHWLTALDRAWRHQAILAPFGARQRWVATVAQVKREGWPVHDGPARWRLGEVTVAWAAVAPSAEMVPRKP